MLNTNSAAIEYAAQTKLIDLAEEFAETRKRDRREKIIDQAATIRYYLKAVELKTTYLDDDAVNAIYQCLIDVAEINNYPTVPILASVAVPDIGTTIIVEGTPGARGADGGATDFEAVGVASDTVVDSFDVTDAYGARWDYVIYDGTNQRQGTISTTWLADGSSIATPAHYSSNDIGDVSPVNITIDYLAGEIRLNAIVTSGTWTVSGSRYFIPNSGAFQGISGGSSALTDGSIFIGSAANIATANPVTGDISLSNTGVTAIASGVIVNADVNGSAAIAVSKLAALTATRAVVSDSSGFLTTVAVTPTEIGYVAGVTSAIQTQLDSKVSAAAGAISTVVAADLTINRAVISNGAGKIAVSAVTSTELGYVSGVTSAIQTQINNRISGLTTLTIPRASSSTTITDGSLTDDGTDVFTNGIVNSFGGINTIVGGTAIKFKVIQIGDWDMDATATVNVAHGLTLANIRSVTGSVRDDAGTSFVGIPYIHPNSALDALSVIAIDATNVQVSRTTGGTFDNTSWNATGYNRGWIVVTYSA